MKTFRHPRLIVVVSGQTLKDDRLNLCEGLCRFFAKLDVSVRELICQLLPPPTVEGPQNCENGAESPFVPSPTEEI
jgi:glycine cleavage system regulatory protein